MAFYSGAGSDGETGCENPAALCDICRGEVYKNELVHVIDGFVVCAECFSDYTFDYFSGCMMLGSEISENNSREDGI